MKNGIHHHHPRAKDSIAELKHDSRALLAATADSAEAGVAAARKRLAQAISQAADNLQQNSVQKAKAVDKAIRENPYKSIAVATGLGILAGFFISRRFRRI